MNKFQIISFLVGLFILAQCSAFAQTKGAKTDTITVLGNCGQCKERIEEAAYVKGVKHVEWNKKSKLLTVTYLSSKTDLHKITKAIALVGHDSRLNTADDKIYNKLPGCCAYRTGVCNNE